MHPTHSDCWNGVEALKSGLAGRLAGFSHNKITAAADHDERSRQLRNHAALLEFDLREIFGVTSKAMLNFSVDEYSNMNQMARDFLDALEAIVNWDLVGRPRPDQTINPVPCDIKVFGDKHPRLSALLEYLHCTKPTKYNLVDGPDPLLFKLSQDISDQVATCIDRTAKWKAFMESLGEESGKSLDPDINQDYHDRPLLDLGDIRVDLSTKSASIFVAEIFKQFRGLECKHDIRLKISNEWYTSVDESPAELLISCCLCGTVMHWPAQCGQFSDVMHFLEKSQDSQLLSQTIKTLCDSIEKARNESRNLYLSVSQNILRDISYLLPRKSHKADNAFRQSLSDLLKEGLFAHITVHDFQQRTAQHKFNSRDKASVALALARCLADFFGGQFDLAAHTWAPESIYFLAPQASNRGAQPFYVSLRPLSSGYQYDEVLNSIVPGNPTLLSFAKLLLEIDSGEKIDITIQAENRNNLSQWGLLCGFLDEAEKSRRDHYLKAVYGCLYLHLAVRRHREEHDGEPEPGDNALLRKIIHQEIVANLQLAVEPMELNLKRKRGQTAALDFPAVKKPLLQQLTGTAPISRFAHSTRSLAMTTKSRMPTEQLPVNSWPGSSSQSFSNGTGRSETRPVSRDDFEVAIICALSVEYDAMCRLIDEFWDTEEGDPYGRAVGDINNYTTGRLGKFSVVLVLLPNMGKVSATGAAASLRSSYPQVKLAIVTGICGGVPHPQSGEELLLGDVVISKTVVQYDLGRQYPDDFEVRSTVEDVLGRPQKSIRALLALLETERTLELLEIRTRKFLADIQEKDAQKSAARGQAPRYHFPGASKDKLFPPDYHHRHHDSQDCICKDHRKSGDAVCEASRKLACDVVGCDTSRIVSRRRLKVKWQHELAGDIKQAQAPTIFVGPIGSGDRVIKSGLDRDKIANHHGILAFEMEATGVWDELPCIMVKGVCDYADSHKNKEWQYFAAATAASATKALLERYIETDRSPRGM